jgi:hypothetical protein
MKIVTAANMIASRAASTVLLFGLIAGGLLSANSARAASAIYIAQNGQGVADGTSCANARAASWFNSGSNWGSGSSQISPGSTVYLCGSISTSLTFQGSGANGSPVTVDGTGATYAGTFNTANRSWWQVQNVQWVNGYGQELIEIVGGSNGVFRRNSSDDFSGGDAVFLAQYNGSVLPSAMTISGNYIRTSAADLGNTQHDIIATEGSTGITIEGNHLEMRAGGTGNNAHNDVIQTWQKGGTSGGPPSNWTVRHNRIVMNSSATNDRSWTMLENLSGTSYIYGNLFLGIAGASEANGISINSSAGGAVFHIYGNTIVAKNSASNNVFNLDGAGQAIMRNNIVHTGSQTALTGSMQVSRDHNIWLGSNIPSCAGRAGELCGVDPKFVDYASNNFSLQSSSPANGVGVALGSPYDKAFPAGAAWPSPTLSQRSGNWSLGAFEGTSAAPAPAALAPPSNLRIVQ